MSTRRGANYDPETLRRDLLVYIYEFVQPRIRELNTILLREDEMRALDFSVRTMLNFGVSLNRKFGREEGPERAFEPNFEALLQFKGMSRGLRITENMMIIMGGEYEVQKAKMRVSDKQGFTKKDATGKGMGSFERAALPGEKRGKGDMLKGAQWPIIYKFKEGCTAGTRRNVNMEFFMK